MTNFISSREKLHCSAQELHTIHKISSNYNKQQHNERHAILIVVVVNFIKHQNRAITITINAVVYNAVYVDAVYSACLLNVACCFI